jgi:isoquinoline 1-oxidoreductase alpha subunit
VPYIAIIDPASIKRIKQYLRCFTNDYFIAQHVLSERQPPFAYATRWTRLSRKVSVFPQMAIKLNINGNEHNVEVDPDTPLLWVLRDSLHLTGTKYGCGIAACGACTVHVDGQAVRSCVLPVAAAIDQRITTIEGLDSGAGTSAVQQAWIDEQVPQCGYCQSGMVMAVTALLNATVDPSDDEVDQAITNICRCGTYPRIRRAIHRAADQIAGTGRYD